MWWIWYKVVILVFRIYIRTITQSLVGVYLCGEVGLLSPANAKCHAIARMQILSDNFVDLYATKSTPDQTHNEWHANHWWCQSPSNYYIFIPIARRWGHVSLEHTENFIIDGLNYICLHCDKHTAIYATFIHNWFAGFNWLFSSNMVEQFLILYVWLAAGWLVFKVGV